MAKTLKEVSKEWMKVEGDWREFDRKQIERLHDQLELQPAVREALRYAISIIEAYELDIRSRQDLVDAGFCQGELYKRALARIEELRNRQ